MGILPPRGKNGARQVVVYHPGLGRNQYVGSRVKLRGPGGAEELFRQKTEEFAVEAGKKPAPAITVAEWAERWLERYHGTGTRRPEYATEVYNRGALTRFLDDFGTRMLDGGIGRAEALDWARDRQWRAKVVAAMYQDAIDEERTTKNPFKDRRAKGGRGRKDIHPLSEQEVDRLGRIALDLFGEYGRTARAWVLFGAWVGCRPGETFRVTRADLRPHDGEVIIRRVKKRGQDTHPVDRVVLPQPAWDAIQQMPRVPVEGPIFRTPQGHPMVKGNLSYWWRSITAAFRATVDEERWDALTSESGRLDFYSLRHACASRIVANGGNEFDVARQLGHSPQMAREVYIHEYVDEANERVRRLLGDGSGSVVDFEARRKGA